MHDCSFVGQLASFRACFKEQKARQTTVLNLTKLLIVAHPAVSSTFSEVCTAFLLFLTLPVSVVSERHTSHYLSLVGRLPARSRVYSMGAVGVCVPQKVI